MVTAFSGKDKDDFMVYIILAAGTGNRLHPITLKHPKTLFSLDGKTTILSRMVSLLRKLDSDGKIVIVCGFQHKLLKAQMPDSGIEWIYNPFYEVTNSLASLWFARDYLDCEVTILNGDIVMSEELMQEVVTKPVDRPSVLMDSSITNGDYNVQTDGETVIVMSKSLTTYSGEYAGVTKLDAASAQELKSQLCELVEDGRYTTWYEDALVQMIFERNFQLFFQDISQYDWTEVDSVDDLTFAKKIHLRDTPLFRS